MAIDLVPEHALDVAVNDELGQPVPGAEIEVTRPADPLPVGMRAPGRTATAHVGPPRRRDRGA